MSCLNDKILDDLGQRFENMKFSYREISFGGNIHVFFVTDIEETDLKEYWEKISEFIATNFQVSLDEEFSVWNIYLFFLVKENVSNEIKYQIENDTFSSRKIVINRETDFDKIINEHIINNNLTITPQKKSDDIEFKPNSIIWEVLERRTLKKKRRTYEAEPALDEIIVKLKEVENEI